MVDKTLSAFSLELVPFNFADIGVLWTYKLNGDSLEGAHRANFILFTV